MAWGRDDRDDPEFILPLVNDKPLTVEKYMEMSTNQCVMCRTIGSIAFVGLGGYTWYAGTRNLELQREAIAKSNTRWGIGVRRLGIQATALGFILVGTARAFNMNFEDVKKKYRGLTKPPKL